MNIKLEKGGTTILLVLMVALFIEFLIVDAAKQVDSLIKTEKKEKERFSHNKIKEIITNALTSYKSCGYTFQKTGVDVQVIKDSFNQSVFDFSVGSVEFYRSSGFFEKSTLKPEKIKIIESNPRNYEDNKKKPIARHPLQSYEFPKLSGNHHTILTLQIVFSESSLKKTYLYVPIYVEKKSSTSDGDIKRCSTSKAAIGQLICEKLSVRAVCCRYIYEITLNPPIGKEFFFSGDTTTKSAQPPNHIDFVRTAEDPTGAHIQEDCVPHSDTNRAEVLGRCEFPISWYLETNCVVD